MARPARVVTDGKMFCPGRPKTHAPKWIALEHWRREHNSRHGTVPTYAPVCKACEIHDRTEAKAADPARAKIERAAADVVTDVNAYYRAIGSDERITKDFVMNRLHYEHLVEPMRFAMENPHCWTSCGEPFKNERDTQLEHREPPRSPIDWPRMDARNIDVKCGTCNNVKTNKPYSQWLDEQWEMYDQHSKSSLISVAAGWEWKRISAADRRKPSESDVALFSM